MRPTGEMIAVADRFFASRFPRAFGASDVLIWWLRPGVVGLAMRGPALRVQRWGLQSKHRNRDSELDIEIQRAFGIDARREGRGIESDVGQTMSDGGDISFQEMVSTMEASLAFVLTGDSDTGSVNVTLMPDEGAPYSPLPGERTTEYYSAKRQKLLTQAKPPWASEVETREGKMPGADFCAFAPKIGSCGSGPVVVQLPKYGLELMVSHSFAAAEYEVRGIDPATRGRQVKACGGMLYSSLAVGEIPASNFGEVSLIADAHVALDGLKPWRTGVGVWPVVIYSTDVWTEVTTDYVGELSALLYQQLTGSWSISVYGEPVMAILGPRFGPSGMGAEDAKILRSIDDVGRTLRKRGKIWHRNLTPAEFEKASEATSGARYGYIEAKSSGILDINCFPLAVCADASLKVAKTFLSHAGWKGDILSVPTTPEERRLMIERKDDLSAYRFAWKVREAVLVYAEKTRRVLAV